MLFTGNKDTDLQILRELNDYDLANVCKVNSTAKKYCNDDNFWLNRIMARFGSVLGDIEQLKIYKGDKTWKQYYIFLIDFLERYYEYYGNDAKDLLDLYQNSPDIIIIYNKVRENTKKFLNEYNDVNLLNMLDAEYLKKRYNNLINLTKIFFKLLWREDLNRDAFKLFLDNPNFKISSFNVVREVFSNGYQRLLFSNEFRMNQIKTRKELFVFLFVRFWDKSITRDYMEKLLPLMSTKEVLDAIRDSYILKELDPNPYTSTIKYVFNHLIQSGLNKKDLLNLYLDVLEKLPRNKTKIKQYIDDLPEIDDPNILNEINQLLQSKKYSYETYKRVLNLLK